MVVAVVLAVGAWGCSGVKECDVADPDACGSDQVCEVVSGRDRPLCLAPVEVRGKVFDLETDAPVAGARVTALDVNGAPVGSVAITDADGNFAVRVPTTRADEEGTVQGEPLTLRAAAQDYQPFPSGVRTALPVDTGTAARAGDSGPWVVASSATDVGLVPLPDAEQGRPSISGTVEVTADQRGVLVAAETGSGATLTGYSGIADASGAYTIFNVAPGTYTVRGYSRGVNYTPVDVDVSAGSAENVHLARSATDTATVSGTIQRVGTNSNGATSVILVLRSSFDELTARGEAPPGLRAPDPGIAPNVTDSFSISGVPDGEYAVLAAFENDGLVRDPDTGQAGTEIQFAVVSAGVLISTFSSFKITGAVTIVGPGADGVEDVTGTPTFTWQAYPQTAEYLVEVFDSFGNLIDSATIPGNASALSHTYAGPALTPGAIYQWRVTSVAQLGQPLSRSEDLKGVFRAE